MIDQNIPRETIARIDCAFALAEIHDKRISELEASIVKLFNLIRNTQRTVNNQLSMFDSGTNQS